MANLIQLKKCTVTRGETRLLGPVSMALVRGKHLALVGQNGSGKTTLLKLLRGDILPDRGGERAYDFGDGPQQTVLGLRQRITMVSSDMQDFYHLNAPRTLGRSIILSGFYDTPLLYGTATDDQEAGADGIIDELGIADLGEARLGTLSTGQLRKLLIARALVSNPDVLLLDECLEGLDVASRSEVLALLEKAADRATLVCAAHRIGDVPRCVNDSIVLEAGEVVRHGDRQDALDGLHEHEPDLAVWSMPEQTAPDYDYLLRMERVSVVADHVRFLHSVNWTVLPGENWMILGDNGAGKSTIIKLAISEISPYADDDEGVGVIERLGGMTMDEARPLIGVVSPALQTTYAREQSWEVTAIETVLSGFYGSQGMLEEHTDEEYLAAQEWLARVGLADLADRPLRRMSYGQQRRVFLARAMAPGPHLLLLDEPMSGLDADSRSLMLALLQKLAEAGFPLVLVTHHVEDRIPAINRVMLMENGRQTFCGTREEFEVTQKQD
ncbi:ATP-binding cassette domain-containing protein [Pseudodesulfovibrio sp. zrk46]|uniref:ATP-binding cassette domain-containing protein n=1 Tax=Pseudodesulfovibrio sp. zrk46 TaxID=2725288 RepID=UPI0014490DCE|nr:ATP-binding cassette domain-containing protein [Pseudodesulfovibrio sp. zrk46]QJB55066.1 ATP-binding cassette domain-containing protein [Pseudodesulfovibrio sp. zrk46]